MDIDWRLVGENLTHAISAGMRDAFEAASAEQPTLRDRFAMAVAPSLVLTMNFYEQDDLMEQAYKLADAALRARHPGAEQEGGGS